MVIYPLSLFCRKILAVSSAPVDAILGLVVLFPAGLIFKSQLQHLPPALQDWLFIPHVAAYMLAYIILAMATAQAMPVIFSRTGENALRREAAAYRLVSLSFPLLTIGLLLGAWWGKKAWGDYWQWDPKELWSLATWLIFLFYLHLRCAKGRRWPRLNSIIVVLGGLAVVITLLWVNLAQRFSGMHSYASP
jgi:ABC-type transport system involved in cytochrome c biogenesis permease subunit